MKRFSNFLVLLLTIAWLLTSCEGSNVEPTPTPTQSPEEGAQEWIDAITNQNGNKMLKHTCLAQRESLQQSLVWVTAFSAVAELFSLNSFEIKLEGDVSDLHFEVLSKNDNQATIRVTGELRVSPTTGIAQAYQVNEEWPMVYENDTWRWCGSAKLASEMLTQSETTEMPAATFSLHALPPTLIGYDLHLIETKDDWTQYTMSVGIKNDSDKAIEIVDIPVINAYVETTSGETYPAELFLTQRTIYRDLTTPPIRVLRDAINAKRALAPSMMALDSLDFDNGEGIFGYSANLETWEFTFKIPESQSPSRLLLPEFTEMNLTDIVARKDMELPNIVANQEVSISITISDNVEMTINNLRISEVEGISNMLIFDIALENKSSSQSSEIVYEFNVIDPQGTWLLFRFYDCGNTERDGQPPLAGIVLKPNQKLKGVRCFLLKPGGYDNKQELKILNTVEELDPLALGLDPNSVMKVRGIEANFIELRHGIEMSDGKYLVWVGNKRNGKILVQEISQQETIPPLPLLSDRFFVHIGINGKWYAGSFRLNH